MDFWKGWDSMAENTRIQDIYVFLKDKGFEVYFPAQKVGECTSPYVVVRDATTTKVAGFSSTVTYYDIMCYVPKDHFSTLEPFVEQVKISMRGLVPMIKPTYTQTQSFYDESVKAHMISIQYLNYRKIIS